MNNEIGKYLGEIVTEVENTTISDYNLDVFKSFEDFDLINFHVLNKHILENGNRDLFIGIPEENYRENFFESVFYAVTLVKLFQNYCSYKQAFPELKSNDIIFTRNRIYKYLGTRDGRMIVEYKFPKKNEKNSHSEIPKGIYTKLDETFDFQKRVTVQRLEGYNTFLKTIFRDATFPLMTEFGHKTLIISDKKLTRINENIPFRYYSRNGVDRHSIPVDTIIEVCNSFTVAETLIQNKEWTSTFDEVIIIGDAKYRDQIFPNIQNGKWNGHFKSIILIGTEKPTTQQEFLQWNWSKREIILAHQQEPNTIQSIEVSDERLTTSFKDFHNYVEGLKTTLRIDATHLLRFTNFFLRQIITGYDAIVANEQYLQRVKVHLDDKEFDQIVLPKVEYNRIRKQEIVDNIYKYFEQLSSTNQSENKKWQQILSIAREQKIFLLVDKRQGEPLRLFLKANEIRNIRLIVNKKLPNLLYFDDFIKDAALNISSATLIVSYLSDPKIFNQLMEVNGTVKILCYEGLDVQIFKNLIAKEENILAKNISHVDRNHFVKAKFKIPEIPIIQTKFYKDIFEFKELTTLRSFNSDGEPSNEGIWYELQFDDGTEDILMASKKVSWVVDGQQTEVELEDCNIGFEIKYYKNSDKNAFQELLKLKDGKGLLESINKSSTLWKNALKTLLLQFKSINKVYKEVMNGNNLVAEKSFERYFDKECSTLFPSEKILEAIYNCFRRNRYSGNTFMTNYNAILSDAALHKSVSIKFGHYLSRLLSGDLTTSIDEVINEANELPNEVKDKVLSFIKVGTIISKNILRSNDTRIPIQSELDFQGQN